MNIQLLGMVYVYIKAVVFNACALRWKKGGSPSSSLPLKYEAGDHRGNQKGSDAWRLSFLVFFFFFFPLILIFGRIESASDGGGL